MAITPAIFLASLPSPPFQFAFKAGPFALSYYGLFIALGIVVATWLTGRELSRKGYDGGYALAIEALFFVVPLGLIGARFSYVVANYDLYANNPIPAVLEVWGGGLEIFGGLVGGFIGLLIFARLRGIGPLAFADAAAPGVILGQAIGRWGDYFNQELFGKPSNLPWSIRISPENRPAEFADATSFHPTFLYESLWDLLVCLFLLWVARRLEVNLKDGSIFLLYICLYSVGYLVVETLRLDPTTFLIAGSIRADVFVGGVLALGSSLILLVRHSEVPRKRSK
jgi:phosphatidylglycerol---prolipoprotein diacylglyceryl transferase